MPKQLFNKRRVPWHAPFPILKRRGTIARFSRKHGKPSAEQQDAAIAAAGIEPIAEPQAPAINHEIRKMPIEPVPPYPGIKPDGIADRALQMLAKRRR